MEDTCTESEPSTGFEFPVTIYYEDTDFTGYVYHANYLKYFERAREQILGVKRLALLYQQGHHFVVHNIELKFLQPAGHGDSLTIKSRYQLQGARLIFLQRAWRDETLLVEARIETVCVNRSGRPRRVPEQIRQHLV